jgi:hypothetical protein
MMAAVSRSPGLNQRPTTAPSGSDNALSAPNRKAIVTLSIGRGYH